MAFEYGAQKLNIRNPFRFEGLVRSIRGLLLLVIGVYLLIQIQPLLGTDKPRAWMSLVIGGLFVVGGLKALGGGLFQVMRFFVGRAAPASLAKNVAREAVNEREPTLYNAKMLHNMLMSKSNPTFVEPLGWFARAVHSVFPNLIVTPWPIRNVAQNLAMKLTKSLVAIAAFLVATLVVTMVFSGTEGADVGSTVISLILQASLLIYLGLLWVKLGNPLSRSNMTSLGNTTSKGLALVIIGSIALPILTAQGWIAFWDNMHPSSRQDLAIMMPLFEPVFRTGTLLTLTLFCALATAAIATVLIKARIRLVPIATSSSEMNNSWRFDLHPRQIFTTLRDLVLMQKRQQELPNRVYLDSNDTGDANRENEQFNGDMLVEIQPLVEEKEEPQSLRWARAGGTVAAQVILFIGALLLWFGADRIMDHVYALDQIQATRIDVAQAFNLLFIPAGNTAALLLASLLLLGFGRTLARICHLFWAEIFFKSNLFDLHCEGTVMRATHYRGADRHSASSEQDVFSFDATYFALATEAVSSTFAVSGQHNLEQPRYLLSLAPCDGFINSVMGDLEEQFRRRNEEIQNEKQADREQRLDYIRQEQEARRTGDMTAQGLVSPERRASLEADVVTSQDREKIARWEGDAGDN
ncbi:hypothetical protein KUV44_07045 [Marinobacter daepoensis]|uniref:Uncharacterized protein n=1 Tax=Marinobacter daepoensis TaxID=262077 RepID=A0ABS3BI55_9GAMM|nr:hypothetical protein [Marinobacter daepoensis]MBN7771025.1 hypothetical protein [Marinobacter daepoensis]MBY6033371.1 hypothetical protein [Marinobacter daepoensis]MBY6078887.1 hypothetical protein [Marinobacter daepoensis]